MPRVLISYRRESGWALAGRLYDVLSDKFGRDRVFIDIDDIGPGADFVTVLEEVLESTDALIPVIDRDWTFATDADGNRRLHTEDDLVRQEIVTALRRNILVVPLLEPGAKFPELEDLPEDLHELTRRNAIEVSQKHFRADVDRLAELLESLRSEEDLEHLGPYADAGARILAEEAQRARWEGNFWLRDAIWAPGLGGAMGTHTMRIPMLQRLERMDLSGDPELAAKRDELATLIRAAPDAELLREESDGTEIHYDLMQTPEITLLLEEVDGAMSVLSHFAKDAAETARARALRDAELSDEQIARWHQNWRVHQAIFVPELGNPSVGPNNRYTRRAVLLDLLNRLDFSDDRDLEEAKTQLIELVNAAPDAGKVFYDVDYDLLLTTEMQLLRADIDTAVRLRGEATAERR